MILAESAIQALTKKIEQLESVRTTDEFYNWQKTTSSTLQNIYPNRPPVIERFHTIKPYEMKWKGDGTRINEGKKEAREYLDSLISDIEHFGLPHLSEKNTTDALNVSVHQHNEQNQSTQVSVNFEYIVEVLRGELRTSEIDELKEILDTDDEPKVKKKRFIDKIKSFGSDVASNILANLLTNPQVYDQLGRML